MNNFELEHIIRAACGITNQDNVVVIGSQAILASLAPSGKCRHFMIVLAFMHMGLVKKLQYCPAVGRTD